MNRSMAHMALVVRDYDEAIEFYTQKLDFHLLEDTRQSEEKRWVLVSPSKEKGFSILLARAVGEEQMSRIGNQTGGRVFLFMYSDNFQRDYELFLGRGIEFVREPQEFDYGKVAVFKDLYGNLWDLIESKNSIDERQKRTMASEIMTAVLSSGKQVSFHRYTESDKRDVLLMMETFYAIDDYPFDATSSQINLEEFTSESHLGRLYLIKHHSENIGYIILTFGYSFEYRGRDAFIDEFFIKKDFRGLGIGNLTMDFIASEAKELGVKAIHLEVESHNVKARSLYLKKGYDANSRELLTKRI